MRRTYFVRLRVTRKVRRSRKRMCRVSVMRCVRFSVWMLREASVLSAFYAWWLVVVCDLVVSWANE